MIYIANDHGGFDLKNKIRDFLINKGYEIEDMGPSQLDPTDDYPDYAVPLVQKVLESDDNSGILICRNGVGMSMVANKIRGIRCSLSWNAPHAISHKRDDNTNVLALAADYIEDEEALHIVESWINAEFTGHERHIRRLKKVSELEK